MNDLERRVTALEEAVARLQAGASPSTDPAARDDRFWMLEGLRARAPGGAVGFAGHLDAAGGRAEWQWARTTDDLLGEDWPEAASTLAALGHPVRLRLLHLVLSGVTATADLAETEGLGTTGQLHHHLRTLTAAGWLTSTGRGRYAVPSARVVPLLAVVAATLPS